ncbi:MAG TPA: PT domain-containing protein [Pirellulaceae bacterium]|jgi:hypothetical protein
MSSKDMRNPANAPVRTASEAAPVTTCDNQPSSQPSNQPANQVSSQPANGATDAADGEPVTRAEFALLVKLMERLVDNSEGNSKSVSLLTEMRDGLDRRKVIEKGLAEVKERTAQIVQGVMDGERALAEGERQFLVTLSDEPNMCRVVGSTDEVNAIVRWERFMGIRKVFDPDRSPQARELSPAEAEVEINALNLASTPKARCDRGREMLGMPELSKTVHVGLPAL